ncbi:DUF4270 domain-containing protein [Aquimarina sp. BL5]|uniref:DUF4270 domain-containing protein n=1 Tax=Aquimarina sp. BL5 TaxID=1714860 RepID=UPI000E4C6D74|nr:DUF4270 domain-containing protein [Aquimarina sp. BL5]AXT52221.1 DUF4270 domain-containing protein [Aquimarina sp. BL5]RKN05629.1 DUF4270 family protein [Aquimarina sp. BL5]
MNLKNVLIKITAIVAVIFTAVSCDDDFNSVGSEVIGDVNFEDDEYNAIPIAYSKRFEKVQTSGLPNNLLGVYNDPVYGQSVYSIVSEVIPSQFNPSFGRDAILDSVVLNVPYFSNITESNTEDGVVVNTFELDSVYGSSDIKLSVYHSDYFLRDFDLDQGAEERQVYFSDDISGNFGSSLENRLLFEENNFKPSSKEIRLLTETEDDATDDTDADGTEFSTFIPALRLVLVSEDAAAAATALNPDPDNNPSTDNTRVGNQELINYFTSLFLDKEGSIELSNPNNFRNYFRGLYFKAESITSDGSLVFFDISDANLTLHYSFETDNVDEEDEDGDGDITELLRDESSFVLNFSNNIVNSIDFDFSNATLNDGVTTFERALDDQDEVNGEANLFLKGGEGSFAVLDLFNGMITNEDGELENELDFLKRQDWLINEASMKIYINQDEMVSGDTEPERIYVFNEETGAVLVDFLADPTSNQTSPILSVTNHLGRISRDSDENGEFYKIRLTRHVINILNEDTDNVKLGLSVSQNVNIVANAEGFTPNNTEDEIIPFSSIISHEGTILYGNRTDVPEEKRLKLDIFYTRTKSN